MKKVNLRDLYPDVYKNDHFVEMCIRDSKPAAPKKREPER